MLEFVEDGGFASGIKAKAALILMSPSRRGQKGLETRKVKTHI
jgi:hypothetical protein